MASENASPWAERAVVEPAGRYGDLDRPMLPLEVLGEIMKVLAGAKAKRMLLEFRLASRQCYALGEINLVRKLKVTKRNANAIFQGFAEPRRAAGVRNLSLVLLEGEGRQKHLILSLFVSTVDTIELM